MNALSTKGGRAMSTRREGFFQQENGENEVHTDFLDEMVYSDYLQLDTLLASQKRLSNHHDEVLFIIIHQVSELWLKLIVHEVNAAIQAIQKEQMGQAFKILARVTKIQSQMIQVWDVLATLTPAEYLKFRDQLGKASGFQSYQYRLFEYALGYKTRHILEIYEHDATIYAMLYEAYHAPSLYDVSIQALARAGFSIHPDFIKRDDSIPYDGDETVRDAWKEVYTNVDHYWELYQLAEKLIDIEDGLQQWRFCHAQTVERIIGMKKGTGGSSGVGYLRNVLDHRFFPELWDVRTEL